MEEYVYYTLYTEYILKYWSDNVKLLQMALEKVMKIIGKTAHNSESQ
jgi:hypothetical protein